jgi:DNA/RNA endonuclease YhcR with UshA esterase domain
MVGNKGKILIIFIFLLGFFLPFLRKEEIFAADYQYVDPLEIKEMAVDSRVETQGVVVALPGALGLQFFYINGCQIYSYYKDFPELEEGDKIRVRGIVSQSQGEKRVKTKEKADIQVLGKEKLVSPLLTNVQDIEPALVGSLIQVQGQVIEKKSPRLFLKDGEEEIVVYFKDHAKIDKGKYQEGDFLKVTGVLSLSKGELRILPRCDDDLNFIFSSPELISEEEISFLILDDKGEDKGVIDFQLIKPYFFIGISVLIIVLIILILLKKRISAK